MAANPSRSAAGRGACPRTSLLRLGLACGLLCLSCRSPETPNAYLTYLTSKQGYTSVVQASGTTEAKTSHVLSVPNLRYQPEITHLAPEGGTVRQGDEVVRLGSRPLEIEEMAARNEVELARAEAAQRASELAMQQALLEAQIQTSEAWAEVSRLQLSKLAFVSPRAQEPTSRRASPAEDRQQT